MCFALNFLIIEKICTNLNSYLYNQLTIMTPLLQRLPSLMAEELSMMRTNTKTSVTLSTMMHLKNRSPSHVVSEYTTNIEINFEKSAVLQV